jgi:phage anti-repressor protein
MSAGADNSNSTSNVRFTHLIPVSQTDIGGTLVSAVDAKDLHKGLGVRKDFTDWAKQNIKRLRMVQDRDYKEGVYPLEGENLPLNGRPSAVYWFTLDVSKHVAMMANTKRGFEVREYFLECERRVIGAPRLATSEQEKDTEPSMEMKISLINLAARAGGSQACAQAWLYYKMPPLSAIRYAANRPLQMTLFNIVPFAEPSDDE